MRGYFSRIARQSGARVRTDAVRADRVAADLSPIDHEETVLISPAEPPRASLANTVDVPEPKAPSVKPSASRSAEKNDKADPTPAPKSSTRTPAAEDVGRLQAATEERSDNSVVTRPAESAERDEQDVGDVLEPALREESVDIDPPVTGAITIQPSEKRFFEKTTGLIEGRPAEPADVHTILLREVQEWIEAGQPTRDVDEVPEPTTAMETSAPAEETLNIERQPGVVRVMEGRRREKVHERSVEVARPTSITEQSFELSIGSISVVVDGGEQPSATPPPVASPRPSAPETPRAVSRLSRHYL